RLRNLLERVPGVRGVRLAGGDRDPRGSPDDAQRLGDTRRVVVLLVRDEDLDVRVPRLVRIAIGGDVDARGPGAVEESDRLVRLAPHADGGELDVRDLEGQPALSRDLDGLLEGREGLLRLVADVR